MVEILSCETFGADVLLEAIRRTRLRGFGGARPYRDASLELVVADPDTLVPAQNYVLTPGVAKVEQLRRALLTMGVDIFALDGGLHLTTADDPAERIPMVPPIVEESVEPDGRTVLLINDGMHRVFTARSLGLPITVVVARDVPAEYPYYAYALPHGWQQVRQFAELPDGHQKKQYRRPTGYHALFRDFNAQFPGMQKARKQTNPSHLTA